MRYIAKVIFLKEARIGNILRFRPFEPEQRYNEMFLCNASNDEEAKDKIINHYKTDGVNRGKFKLHGIQLNQEIE